MRSVETLIESYDYAFYQIPRASVIYVDGREVNIDFVIEGYSCNTGDYDKEGYGISVHVKPSIEECSNTFLNSVATFGNISRAEVTDDDIAYAGNLPTIYDVYWEGKDGLYSERWNKEFQQILDEKIEELKLSIGFRLDQPQNCSGTNGWDILESMI